MTLVLILATALAMTLSGLTIQRIWNNQLGDIYSVGLGSAACLGGAFSACTGIADIYTCALLSCLACLTIGGCVYKLCDTRHFITFGMIFGFGISAVASILANNAEPDSLQTYYRWAASSLSPSPLENQQYFISVILFVVGICGIRGGKVTAFVSASLLATSVICIVGVIGMISLVSPNVARLISQKHQTIISIGVSILLLSVGYLVARYANFGIYIPISAAIQLIAIPFCIITLRNESRTY